MKTLHILNGDATLHGFQHSGLDGDTLVWREVFSEGPLLEDIVSAKFWQTRSEWISKTMGATEDGYQHDVVDQLGKLNESYQEINLWFEFDLHCQANLLGVMVLIERYVDLSEPVISLICPDNYPGVEDFRGMGQLNGDQLADLYDNRVQLSGYDFDLAAQAWSLFVKGDAGALRKWIEETTFWGGMTLLKPALEAHLKKIETNSEGLNYIEQLLLDACHAGAGTRAKAYQKFWTQEKIYGMSDRDLDIYLDRLKEKGLIGL